MSPCGRAASATPTQTHSTISAVASLLNTSRTRGMFKERLKYVRAGQGRKRYAHYRKGLPPSEKSLHTLRGKGKLFNKIARVWLWLISKEEVANRRFLLTYIYPRFMNSTYDVILKCLSGPSPRFHFEQYKQFRHSGLAI